MKSLMINFIHAARNGMAYIIFRIFLVGPALLLADNARAQQSSSFRASVVKINITPEIPQNLVGYGPRNSTGTHDPIFHKIVALDDGNSQFFIISTDICLVSPSEYDKVAAKIQRLYGIDPINVWWTVTHTHSAPEVGPPGMYAAYMSERVVEVDPAYTENMEQQLIDGIKEARDKLDRKSTRLNYSHLVIS